MSKHTQKGLAPQNVEKAPFTPRPNVAEALLVLLTAIDQSVKETAIEQWSRYHTNQNQEVAAPASDELLTVEKTAELLNVVPQTILCWRKSGILTGYRMGNRVYFKRSEVLAALKVQSMPDGRRKYARRQYEQKAR